MRPGESDLDVLHQIYWLKSYGIGSGTLDRVKRRYDAILAAGRKPIVVDAGANIGISTIWFARSFPEAQVIAIEPDPGNFALLHTNIARYPHCVALEAALGSKPGFAELSRPESQLAWAVRTTRSSQGVPILSVEDAFARSGGDDPFIVKIDIEGFERDVFASNLEWLDRTYVVFVEPHDWMFPGERISAGLQRAMAERPFELLVNGDTLAYVRV